MEVTEVCNDVTIHLETVFHVYGRKGFKGPDVQQETVFLLNHLACTQVFNGNQTQLDVPTVV